MRRQGLYRESYTDRRLALSRTPRAGWATYRDPRLGIRFDYLANRQVRPCSGGQADCIALIGWYGGWRQEDPLLELQVFDGQLEPVARREAGFEPRNGGWFTTYGRFAPVQVERFRSNGLEGMKAVITCGISDKETGFHAAAGECLWMVLSNGRRSVVVAGSGTASDDPLTLRSANSIAFER